MHLVEHDGAGLELRGAKRLDAVDLHADDIGADSTLQQQFEYGFFKAVIIKSRNFRAA